MTRYEYSLPLTDQVTVSYWWVHDVHGEVIGYCRRVGKRWHACIYTDPYIIGTGRTRDDAVDDAYQQVGGPG
jgi:hypothetical protein